jgi:hypothetical protein
MAIGAGGWLMPRTSAALFGMGSAGRDPNTALMFRMFGIRDLLLGSALQPAVPVPASVALKAGLVADSMDFLAGLRQMRQASRGSRGWGLTLGAAAFALAGAGLLRAFGQPSAEASLQSPRPGN